MKTVKQLSVIVVFLLIFSCLSTPPTTIKVLFIGSSMIYTNDMPGMFRDLSESMGKNIFVEHSTAPGAELYDHVESKKTLQKIQSQIWDYVIVSEHNMVLINEERHTEEMHPSLSELKRIIEESGSRMYIMTNWAAKRGGMLPGLETYEKLQDYFIEITGSLAEQYDIGRIPVGDTWKVFLRNNEVADLWGSESALPGYIGTYLSVCVLYSSIFGESSEGSAYLPEMVSVDTLEDIRKTAFDVVMTAE
jgi:Domain of unknown function (DUF4886)